MAADNEKVRCTVCNDLLDKAGLSAHMNAAHSNLTAAQINKFDEFGGWVDCDTCRLHCKGKRGLNIHESLVHKVGNNQRRRILPPQNRAALAGSNNAGGGRGRGNSGIAIRGRGNSGIAIRGRGNGNNRANAPGAGDRGASGNRNPGALINGINVPDDVDSEDDEVEWPAHQPVAMAAANEGSSDDSSSSEESEANDSGSDESGSVADSADPESDGDESDDESDDEAAVQAVGIAPVALEEEDLPEGMVAAPFGLGIANGVVLPEAEYGNLLAKFSSPCDRWSRKWIAPITEISTKLYRIMMADDESTVTRAICAHNLLPGMLQYCNRRKKRGETPIGFLRMLATSEDPVSDIIRIAEGWYQNLPPPKVFDAEEDNVERTRRYIETQVGKGHLSGAAKALFKMQGLLDGVVPAPQLTAEERSHLISTLHPPANEMDEMEEWIAPQGEGHRVLSTTAHEIRESYYHLDVDKASGPNGWTNSLLKAMGDDKMSAAFILGNTEPNDYHIAVAAFANKIASGTIWGVGRELLVQGKLSLIPKAAGLGLRPIRVEGCDFRLITATLNRGARRDVAQHLRPMQMGGGLPHGVEMAARILDINYDAGNGALALDIKNAFNATRHNTILSGLKVMAPHLIPLFLWKYGQSSNIRDNKGVIVATNSTGVGQGDPWGSLFFEVAIHASLVRVRNRLAELEAEHYQQPGNVMGLPGKVFAYEDDTYICSNLEVLSLLALEIPDLFAVDGFLINVHKSYIFGLHAEEMGADAPDGYVMKEEGMTSLGIPIGCQEFRRAAVRDKLEVITPPIAALAMLNPRSAMMLLLKCLNKQPSFLLRCTPGWEQIRDLVRLFDTATATAVASILQFPLNDTREGRMFLPKKHGGLSLTRHSGMATEKGRVISGLAAIEFFTLYHPERMPALQQSLQQAEVRLGRYEGVADFTGLTEEQYSLLEFATAAKVLGEGQKKGEAQLAFRAHRFLVRHDQHQDAAWMLSACTESTAYVSSIIGISSGQDRYFAPEAYRLALRALLGVGPSNEPDHTPKVCGCHKAYLVGENRFHAHSCFLNAPLRTARHDEIKRRFCALLKQRFVGANINMEVEVGSKADGSSVTADIVVHAGAVRYVIDVMVMDMGATEYLRGAAATNPAATQDAAAVMGEKKKRRVYGGVVHPARIPEADVIPFVLEATGRLGPKALSFVREITAGHTALRTAFNRQVSTICAIYSGRMLKATRERYLLPQGNAGMGGA